MPYDGYLHFPGFPPIKGVGEPITAIEAEMPQSEAIEKARKIGEFNGKNAASWVFDGNTTTETYETVLKGIEDGDPAIYDMFTEPNFSGEYGDSYSERDLADDIGISYDDTKTEEMDEIADHYLDAARWTFWHEIERVARLQLG
jgi:hypothetical protein